jgi:hypothetical protein
MLGHKLSRYKRMRCSKIKQYGCRDRVDKEHTKHHLWVLLSGLSTHMVHPATALTLLSFVALRGLVPAPHLLHLLVLHRGAWGVPLRIGISLMPNLSTFKASVARGGVRCTGPHGRTNWSHQTVLRVRRAWSLRPWARKLLRRALKLLVLLWLVLILLLLAITSCRASWTERGSQW